MPGFLVVADGVDDPADPFLECSVVVEFYPEVSCEVEVVCQFSNDGLEEGVDGLDAESVVVVYDHGERLAAVVSYELFERRGGGGAWFVAQLPVPVLYGFIRGDFVDIVFGVVQSPADSVELAGDSLFHLGCGFVGESHSQDVAVGRRVLHQVLDVFHSECECLSASCRSLAYFQGFFCWVVLHLVWVVFHYIWQCFCKYTIFFVISLFFFPVFRDLFFSVVSG